MTKFMPILGILFISFTLSARADLVEHNDFQNVLVDKSNPNKLLVLPQPAMHSGKLVEKSIIPLLDASECEKLEELQRQSLDLNKQLLRVVSQTRKSIESTQAILTLNEIENLGAIREQKINSDAIIQKLEENRKLTEQESYKIGGIKQERFDFYSERLASLREYSKLRFEPLEIKLGTSDIHTAETLKTTSNFNKDPRVLDIKFGSYDTSGQFNEKIELVNGLVMQTTFTKAALCHWSKTGVGLETMTISITYPQEIQNILDSSRASKIH